MAKAMAMLGEVESRRIAAAVLAGTGATAHDVDARRDDLLTNAVLAVLEVALNAFRLPALLVGR